MKNLDIKPEDKPFYDRIVAAATEGMGYWRPGDMREAQHVIGSDAYYELLEKLTGAKICTLFYKAVGRGDLPLRYLDKDTNKHCLYIPKD